MILFTLSSCILCQNSEDYTGIIFTRILSIHLINAICFHCIRIWIDRLFVLLLLVELACPIGNDFSRDRDKTTLRHIHDSQSVPFISNPLPS